MPSGDLFSELRRIKDDSQLSYNRLADKTHYSRSSWERFLNGKQLPTKVAVEQFAAAAGVDPAPLLALLGSASVGSDTPADKPARPTAGRTDPAGPPPGPAAPETAAAPSASATTATAPTAVPGSPAHASESGATDSAPVRRVRWGPVLRSAAGIAAGGLLGSLLTLYATSSADAGTPQGARSGAPSGQPVKVGCKSDTCLHREPQAEDCQWDAVSVRETYLRGMSIQLRYSEACQAVWGRIENGNIGDTVKINDKRSSSDEATIRMEHDTYTRMLAVSPDEPWQTITICGAIPSQKEQECSPLGEVTP